MLFAEDVINLAALQVVRRIKQICEEIGFPVKVTRSQCHEHGEKLKNFLPKKVVFTCAQRDSERSEDENFGLQFKLSANGFVVDCGESERSSADSALRLAEANNKCSLRLHLIATIHAHNHSPRTSFLPKML